METGRTPPPSVKAELPLLLRELNWLELRNGVLYRQRQDGSNATAQLVLPEELREIALHSLHNDMGHMGDERTIDLIRARFYWPRMYMAIEKLIKTCERLPIDLAFGLPTITNKLSHSQYVSSLKRRLEQSYRIVTSTAQKNADRNKTRFDKRVVESTLEMGDRILVHNVKLRGKHKLANKWEYDVYVVLKKAGDMPAYTVKPECKSGPVRTLHRDLLLPCGFLPAAITSEPIKQRPFSSG
ncbi:hypothetical protein D4764_04G0005530 [Takifugu flavidus]|uniref:Gypsy retrotransposon integrase-like protein 1 n=1 Tax=Takifugu flavidus TaxID=433684 RepID=A0A5C6N3S7_9TELE|nr:hypothetical protein D4764_04G0005530 [Takifugu flavidus]